MPAPDKYGYPLSVALSAAYGKARPFDRRTRVERAARGGIGTSDKGTLKRSVAKGGLE